MPSLRGLMLPKALRLAALPRLKVSLGWSAKLLNYPGVPSDTRLRFLPAVSV